MRLLLEPEPDTDLDALTRQAQAAHAAGLDGIMLRQTRSVPVPLIVAAALAGRVEDLLLAVEVDVGDRHPFELAEEVAVVDLAIAGRLVLVAHPAPGAEQEYGEALDLLRTALTARPFRFDGSRWRVPAELPENVHNLETHVRLTPAPAQVRPEIWGSGSGRSAALQRGLGYLADADADPGELGLAHERAAEALGPAAIGAPRARRETLSDADSLVTRLRAGREAFGQDWAVVGGGSAEAAALGTQVRPRVQLHRLNPVLERLWEMDGR
ncbi:MAG TPA: LLM class flavin-dependent oxidoreductase [Solirubrobacteraceae bacterium]|nr:LLM class flavin-dependent oxidoreductase [Solirubrobacteraceae bacterium]HTX10475.1 LLM class flavin-dependent oxidoreductase [Solirubrobacteraceae bacterium]